MRRLFAVLAIVSCVLLGAIAPAESAGIKQEKYTAHYYDAFDTDITLIGYCSSADEFELYSGYAGSRLEELHRLFDIYHVYSEPANAGKINSLAGVESVKVSDELFELVTLGVKMYYMTSGRVNIAMGSVLKQWHAVRELNAAFPGMGQLPEPEALKAAAEHTDIGNIVLDEENSSIFLSDPEMSLDLGAVAKGYAVEKLAEELKELGWEAFAINAGGNIRTAGEKPDGSSWRVAIVDPASATGGEYVAAVNTSDTAVVTSGVNQRSFFYEGRRYHHIIDPDTLIPEERFLSVTVIYPDSALADALSTALFNMELADGRALAEKYMGAEVLWVLPDGKLEYTPGFDPADIIN